LDPLQRELKHGAKKQLELAKILIKLNQTKEARIRIDSSLKIINRENFKKLKGAYYGTEMFYYEKINKPEIALKYSILFNSFQDSIFQTQLKLGLSKQIISHSLNQKIVENDLLRKNEQLNSLRNKSYLILLLSLVLILFVIIYVMRNLSKKNLELNAALKEIEEQKQELQFSNSNINYLLQTVAHDLRTPVGNNLSLSRLLLESTELQDDEKDLVKLMNTSSQHAISIMEDLLDHSLIERREISLNKSNVNLSKLITDAARILSYKATPKNIRITSHIPDQEVYAHVDESRISRIVQNLVTNAIKFSQKNEEIIIELTENSTSIQIFVKDNGIGMDEDTRKLAFDSFTSVGRTGTSGEKSYGLGLSICKKLVELHGGKIGVESFPGKGSTFYIEIPKLEKS
ncbi:MAG: sensor histidine kinase, partial [Bacteroidia bacterium]